MKIKKKKDFLKKTFNDDHSKLSLPLSESVQVCLILPVDII